MNTTTADLVPVQFHGDTLDAIQDADGRVWVSLRRCCENLGVNDDGQRRKLKEKAWAVTNEMLVTGPDGKQYRATVLLLDSLPMWLVTIEPRKVKEHIAEKLARYQKEAAKVLADHFFGRPVKPAGDPLLMLAEVVIEVRRDQLSMKDDIAAVRETAEEALRLATTKDRRNPAYAAPRTALDRLLDSPDELAAVLSGAKAHGGVYRAIAAAVRVSTGLVGKTLSERGLRVERGGLVPITEPSAN